MENITNKKRLINLLWRKSGESRYMIMGISIALVSYLVSFVLPKVPGLVIQFIGLSIFAVTMVHTVMKRLFKSGKNIKSAYNEAKGREIDAD